MKKVMVLTGTRAEYGILRPLLMKLNEVVELSLLVTGSHLSEHFGMTVQEIEKDGFSTIIRVPILDEEGTAHRMAKGLSQMAEVLEQLNPDLFILLGDRYECLAAAIAATTLHIPICHIHGGEITLGAMDEMFRHAITKLSHLHFTSTDEYAKRVIQMGEAPVRVHAVGALGVENARELTPMTEDEIEKRLGFIPVRPILVTYHPETMSESPLRGCNNLCKALLERDEEIIITGANADELGEAFNILYKSLAEKKENIHYYDSLGLHLYMSLLGRASCVVGNSSSGILEAPSFGIATLNIGERQRGRIQASSVINVSEEMDEIRRGLERALSYQPEASLKNPYEGEHTSARMTEIILAYLQGEPQLIKEFYDV